MWTCSSAWAEKTAEEAFTKIYQSGKWNEKGFSLSGAGIGVNRGYVAFLQEFMRKNGIRTVVDLGCGDWQFSQYIDWSGIQYAGYDVVEYVIERNQRLFAAPSVMFIHADAIETDLPEADLLICKDVLQHLPNGDVGKLIRQLSKFKHCLITNDVYPKTKSSHNPNIVRGSYRPIDLTQPPFNVAGEKVYGFRGAMGSMKQVLHVSN